MGGSAGYRSPLLRGARPRPDVGANSISTILGDLPDEPHAVEIRSCGGQLVRKLVSHVEDRACLARFVGGNRRPVPSTEHLDEFSDHFLRKRIVLGDQVRHVSTSQFEESAKTPWTRTIVGRIDLSSRLVMPYTSLGRTHPRKVDDPGRAARHPLADPHSESGRERRCSSCQIVNAVLSVFAINTMLNLHTQLSAAQSRATRSASRQRALDLGPHRALRRALNAEVARLTRVAGLDAAPSVARGNRAIAGLWAPDPSRPGNAL